jgi:hypothetical protein
MVCVGALTVVEVVAFEALEAEEQLVMTMREPTATRGSTKVAKVRRDRETSRMRISPPYFGADCYCPGSSSLLVVIPTGEIQKPEEPHMEPLYAVRKRRFVQENS